MTNKCQTCKQEKDASVQLEIMRLERDNLLLRLSVAENRLSAMVTAINKCKGIINDSKE